MKSRDTRSILLCLLVISVSPAFGGQAEDAVACAKNAKEFGRQLSEFDASYEEHVFSNSFVRWPNAFCEVQLSVVYNLTVDGEPLVIDEYAGQAAFDLNQTLEAKTASAIGTLENRIALLRRRMTGVSENLKKIGSHHAGLARYVDDGVAQALGMPLELTAVPKNVTTPSMTTTITAAPATATADASNSATSSTPQLAPDSSPPTKSKAGSKPGDTQTRLQASAVDRFATGQYWVTSETLNRRTCPREDCGIVGKLSFREAADVAEIRDGWARVTKYYDASCTNGKSDYVDSGNNRCVESNGIKDGRFAEWVSFKHLSRNRPADPGAGAVGVAALIRSSDDFGRHKDAFVRATQSLLANGTCREADFEEIGGWWRSTNHASKPIYFTYCGGVTQANRIYLDVSTGRIFR